MKLSYVLTLFLGIAFFKKVNGLEIIQGKCPHDIGTIESGVSQSLDYERISGAWITIYDENDLKDLYKRCLPAIASQEEKIVTLRNELEQMN